MAHLPGDTLSLRGVVAPEPSAGPARSSVPEPEQPAAPAPRTEPRPLAARTRAQQHAEPSHPAVPAPQHHAAGAEPPHPASRPPADAGFRTADSRAESQPPAARDESQPTAPRPNAQPAAAPADAQPPAALAASRPTAPRPDAQPPAASADPQADGAERSGSPAVAAVRGDVPAARGGSGVPGPGVAEIVAQAVARGIDGREGTRAEAGRLARRGPVRGAAVTEVPVHLPFAARPQAPAEPPRRPAERTAAPAARRVPRGDERLREHRGPVLPGWIAVVVGLLALTGCAAVLWRAGVVPAALVAAFGMPPRPYQGLRVTHWPPLAFLGIVTLLSLGGLGRAKAGHAWVLTLFGRYRGTVRRTGLTWISPLLLRRRVDVRLRHWRSEPMPAVDSGGLALQVVVQVVWQVRDTARATLAVEDHIDYLAEQVESATARVLSRLPADAFHDDAPTLRDAEAVGEALTRTLAAETEAVGIEVFSAQPTRIEYAPEVAEAMRRRRIAAIDAKHRDTVLTAVVDAVDDTVHRLTSRGIVDLDDYERKALVKDLTVAFYTGRSDQ
ncbi:SPFH domain-containing protein [Streptomyces sp. NPDC000075]|uniref:SPFH domain-containing protein n=1 Tax=Streptomyces TaxID=1883 RepID=UPI0031D157D3